jgi:hypothetical protein
MARTAIAAGLVALSYDAGVVSTTQTPDAANGNVLPFAPAGTPPTFGPFHVVLVVTNADTAAHTLIIRGSGYTGAAAGAANSGLPSPANTVFTQGSLGDASYAVAASSTQYIGPLTTDRFVQPNHTTGGDLWLDWTASTSMTVAAILLPTNPV